MNNQTILLLIAICVLVSLLFVVSPGENFDYQPYVHQPGFKSSSLNCEETPDAPGCQEDTPDPDIEAGVSTCAPSNGVWSIPGKGQQGRSKLNSKCCQPPNFELGKEYDYKTCADNLNENDPTEKCVKTCCDYANDPNNYNAFDSSWRKMANCACSLWCYNKSVPHFSKYGTAVHYISGDLAEAKTSDAADFIGSKGGFSGA